MCRPRSRPAQPAANHKAGENGLIKVPMILPYGHVPIKPLQRGRRPWVPRPLPVVSRAQQAEVVGVSWLTPSVHRQQKRPAAMVVQHRHHGFGAILAPSLPERWRESMPVPVKYGRARACRQNDHAHGSEARGAWAAIESICSLPPG